MMIRAIVFDFDGVIVDTEQPEYSSWVEIYHRYGQDLLFTDWAACLGTTQDAFDPVANLESKLGRRLPERQEIWTEQTQTSLARAMQQPVLPGVLDVLDRADQLGLGLAVASSSDRSWVIRHLERLDLARRFQCVYTKDEVSPVKPDPGLYLAAVRHLGVQPNEALAFEDSPNGIRAAKAAGMICVAAPNPLSAKLDLSRADFSIPSFAAQSLDDVLDRANQILGNNHHH